MYIPKHFEQHDAAVMKALTEANPLGAMVICDSQSLVANHIPFELQESSSKLLLLGHVARANSVWRNIEADTQASLSMWSTRTRGLISIVTVWGRRLSSRPRT